jgi:TPR repeat protein
MSIETRLEDILLAERIPSADDMYRMGIEASTGVEGGGIDLVAAHKWFNLAALHGNEDAVFYRKQLTAEMCSRDVASAQREAREWLRKHRPIMPSAA